MSNPTANPLGAGGDVTKAAPLIRAYLDKQDGKEPKGQPQPPAEKTVAPEKANQVTEQPKPGPAKDPASGKFVKAEPVEDDTRAEGADVSEPSPSAEKSDEHEELADTIDGLAQQLGFDPDELASHLKAKVKVNGQEKLVNLKEALAGYQMESDYRLKTAETAEQRRQAERAQQEYTQQREHLASQLQPLVQQMETVVNADDQRLQQLLQDGDLLEYERLKWQADQRKSQLNVAKQESQRIDVERQRESRVRLEQHVAEQERVLIEARPDWAKDTDKGKRELSEIRAYLKEQGVVAEQADTLYEAVPILIADKARKWDQLQREKASRLTEVKTVPKFQKPGASKPPVDEKKQVHRTNLNRLRKSGHVRDAAQALKSGGFV